MRQWAARLATRADHRDYIGQLRHLYGDILERWRYVAEPGEWVHGTAQSMLEHVAGLAYNTPRGTDVRNIAVDRVPSKEKGWGDCDDVSTLVAAGVHALGMTPYWRVARGDTGAHVSVLAKTPRGQWVSIDPVGHPEHEFGWALPAPDVQVFELDGSPVGSMMFGGGRQSAPMGALGDHDMRTQFMGFAGAESARPTHLHWAAVPMGDTDGPRVLAMAMRPYHLAMRGIMLDGTEAVDEHGKTYRYCTARDLWVPKSFLRSNTPMGSREKRRARRKRRAGKVRKFFKRVVQKVRGVVAKVMNSPIAQNVVGTALMAIGVPRRLTKGVLAVAGDILRQGGIPALIRLLRKDPKAAARLVAQAAKQGLRAATKLFGPEVATGEPVRHLMWQPGCKQPFYAAPVMALAGVPYLYDLGELEISAEPTPGSWYKIKRGDNLTNVAARAYGLGAGGERLKRMKWINAVQANQYAFDPAAKDNLFPNGRITFLPRFASDPEQAIDGVSGNDFATIWIPAAAGDEPPPQTPDVPDVGPEIPDIPPEPDPPIEPETPDLPEIPPDPPVEPELPEIPPEPPTRPETPRPQIPEVIPPHIPPVEPPQIPEVDEIPDIVPPRPQLPQIPPRPQIPPSTGQTSPWNTLIALYLVNEAIK